MKNILTAFFIFFTLGQAGANGISFSTEGWKQLIQNAKNTNKMIFVDLYATWCGPCKHLEKDIFTNGEVGNYFNEHFINKRIDAESEELELVKQINIEAYPTLVFFDANGEILYKTVGAPETEQLISYAKLATTVNVLKINGTWKSGISNLRPYLEALATHDPVAAEKLASDYLNGLPQNNIRTGENWTLLTTYVTDVDDPSWQYVINNITALSKVHEDVVASLEKLGDVLMQKAILSKKSELVSNKTNLDLLAGNLQGDSSTTKEQHQHRNYTVYLEGIKDYAGHAKSLNAYVKKYNWDDALILTYYASKILSGTYQLSAMNSAILWAERALIIDKENYTAYWVLAIGYSKTKNISKSNMALQNFLRLSKTDSQLPEKVNLLLWN